MKISCYDGASKPGNGENSSGLNPVNLELEVTFSSQDLSVFLKRERETLDRGPEINSEKSPVMVLHSPEIVKILTI